MDLSVDWAHRLIDGLPTFACLLTADGALVAGNRAALEAANLTPQAVLQRRFEETYWWSYSPAVQQELRDAIGRAAAGATVRYEALARVGEAHFICLDLSIAPILDDHGVVCYLMSSGVDITEQRAAQDAQGDRGSFLNSIANTTPVLLFEQAEAAAGGFVYEWDVRTNQVHRSPGVRAILGYAPDDIPGTAMDWRSLVHPDDMARLDRLRPTVLASHDHVNAEYRVRHKDGHYIWVWERGIIYRNADGEAERVIGSTVDITERKHAEDAVRQSEERFRALRDANIIGIIYTNFDGRIIEANDAFLRLLGFTREDLHAGRIDWRKLTPTEWQDRDVEALAELQSTGRATPWEKEYYRKNGSRTPVLVGASLMNDQTRDVTAFILDISERKKLEQRKDDFIALASHELKTPITTLKTYTQALRRRFEGSGDDSTVRLVARMETQINRLVEVVQDLLDVSRIQDGKLTLNLAPFVMDDLVRELVAEMQPITAHELRVEADAGETILADRERIRQVLINLLFNAVTYSPKTEPILIRCWRDADGTHVSVVDHGIGIPQSEQTRIFDRFYQIDSSSGKTYPGLGLGLFISAEIMKRHRGQLSVESEVGRGSTFTLTLPDSATEQGEQADV
ncbi:MAG: PAS domain S-box protein [Anaerolineae bacterium]